MLTGRPRSEQLRAGHWLPDGSVIRGELEQLARDLARAGCCREVHSPVLGKRALYERSGHWGKFSDDMFPPMPVGGEELVLRPANCPHHALIHASRRHSYRELPVRLHEMAAMFRAERSGVLSALTRVRQINLDDTHVFCRHDQVADEAARALRTALVHRRSSADFRGAVEREHFVDLLQHGHRDRAATADWASAA